MGLDILAAATAALTVVNAGVFFAFSTFVVPAARRIPAVEAVHMFQSFNRVIPRSLYLPVFLLSGLGGLATAIAGLVAGEWWYVAGGAVAFVALVVSIAINIPRNNALDAAGDADAEPAWRRFVGGWAVGNHVRTVLCLVAAGLLAVGFFG